MRNLFSRRAVLHDFFKALNFYRILTEKALEFPVLFKCCCEIISGHGFLSGRNGGEAVFLILLLSLKYQAGLNIMQASETGDIHFRLHRLLDNDNFLLRSLTVTSFLPQEDHGPLKIGVSVRHIFKPISYLEILLLSGVSEGYIMIFRCLGICLNHYPRVNVRPKFNTLQETEFCHDAYVNERQLLIYAS